MLLAGLCVSIYWFMKMNQITSIEIQWFSHVIRWFYDEFQFELVVILPSAKFTHCVIVRVIVSAIVSAIVSVSVVVVIAQERCIAWFKQFSTNNRPTIPFGVIHKSTSTQLPFVLLVVVVATVAAITNACCHLCHLYLESAAFRSCIQYLYTQTQTHNIIRPE